jgi:hypothetical protein
MQLKITLMSMQMYVDLGIDCPLQLRSVGTIPATKYGVGQNHIRDTPLTYYVNRQGNSSVKEEWENRR